MKRTIATFIGVGLLATAAGAYQNFFWNGHQDFSMPDTPCYAGTSTTIGAVPFTLNGELWTLYTCSDNRQWARRWSIAAPATATAVSETYTPVPATTEPATISCPGTHPACAMLPAGSYDKAWADGIVK